MNETLADGAVELFDKLRVPDIDGQPLLKDAGGEWVRDMVRLAFGSVDIKTGHRKVGEIFNLVPKKNGKTTNAAAMGIVALQMNTTPNIDGVIIGPTQSIADKCFTQMCAMIDADDYLRERFKVIQHTRTIIDLYKSKHTGRPLNAKLVVKSFDPAVVTGSVPAFAILDELHVMAERHYADRVIRQIRGGMITNPKSLLIFITTQSENPPEGIFKDELEYARKVRDGKITKNVRMMPIMYEFPQDFQMDESEPWRDVKYWPFVLPNLNRSISIDRLEQDFQKAKDTSEKSVTGWLSQHLNIEIGIGTHAAQWAGVKYWIGAKDPEKITFESLLDRSDVITVGIDGGGLDDMFGLCFTGRDKITGDYLSWFKSWIFEDAMDRRKQNVSKYDQFANDGDLVICEDPTQDIDEMTMLVAEVNNAGLLPEKFAVGLDSVGMPIVLTALMEAGLNEDQIVFVPQGYKLSGVIKGMERSLKSGTYWHDGSDMMVWCVGNAKATVKGSATYIDKQTAGSAKIDPLVAGFNAFSLISRNPVASGGPSVYETRGLLMV